MGAVTIGAGVVLWWLAPDVVRHQEEVTRVVLGRASPFRRWPRGMRALWLLGTRAAGVLLVLAGVALLMAAGTAPEREPAPTTRAGADPGWSTPDR
jgi:hypothetical protein